MTRGRETASLSEESRGAAGTCQARARLLLLLHTYVYIYTKSDLSCSIRATICCFSDIFIFRVSFAAAAALFPENARVSCAARLIRHRRAASDAAYIYIFLYIMNCYTAAVIRRITETTTKRAPVDFRCPKRVYIYTHTACARIAHIMRTYTSWHAYARVAVYTTPFSICGARTLLCSMCIYIHIMTELFNARRAVETDNRAFHKALVIIYTPQKEAASYMEYRNYFGYYYDESSSNSDSVSQQLYIYSYIHTLRSIGVKTKNIII